MLTAPAETSYLRIQMDYVHQKTWLQYPVEPSAEAYSHNRADGRVLCVSQWVFSFSIPIKHTAGRGLWPCLPSSPQQGSLALFTG